MRRSLAALAWLATACGGGGRVTGGDPASTSGIRLLDPTPGIRKRAAESAALASSQDRPRAASADGSVLVGTSTAVMNDSVDLLVSEPFRFSEATGTVGLGTFPDGVFNEAGLVSRDGSTVV